MHKARKRFGQNFLIDNQIIRQIIQSLQLNDDDQLLEIGPGKGALTEYLLEKSQFLYLLELDRDLIPILRVKFHQYSKKFQIYNRDALKFNLSQEIITTDPIRVVGNLPYNISTPLLFHLLSFRKHIKDMNFMLQNEVVMRMIAEPEHKSYGRLSVMLQYYCQIDKLFEVPPESFEPRPKVMSAIVRLMPFQNPEVIHGEKLICEDSLEKICQLAFAQKRKTLKNNLKKIIPESEFVNVDIDPSVRAESLSIQSFIRLANLYHKLYP